MPPAQQGRKVRRVRQGQTGPAGPAGPAGTPGSGAFTQLYQLVVLPGGQNPISITDIPGAHQSLLLHFHGFGTDSITASVSVRFNADDAAHYSAEDIYALVGTSGVGNEELTRRRVAPCAPCPVRMRPLVPPPLRS